MGAGCVISWNYLCLPAPEGKKVLCLERWPGNPSGKRFPKWTWSQARGVSVPWYIPHVVSDPCNILPWVCWASANREAVQHNRHYIHLLCLSAGHALLRARRMTWFPKASACNPEGKKAFGKLLIPRSNVSQASCYNLRNCHLTVKFKWKSNKVLNWLKT